ncbi:hypothetical protein BOTBODRAFT_119388, partial [Botryobasidium botryosum FD-172 SS1]
MVNALLQASADVNLQEVGLGHAALHSASKRGLVSTVRFLLASGADQNLRNWCGKTALHIVLGSFSFTLSGSVEVVSALCEAGAAINAKDRYGGTPLHDASQYCPPLITRLLLESGADP